MSRLRYLLVGLCILLCCGACKGKATPTPPPMPTPLPTATPLPEQTLADSRFAIYYGGTLIATEEIQASRSNDQIVVYSELRGFIDYSFVERRTLVLSSLLNPVRYDLERSALGARSTWVASRTGEEIACLNNNLDWSAPVLVEGIKPIPQIMLESSPSALPFALLALRYQEGPAPLQLHCLDVLEDLPQSRPMTITLNMERTGEIIGTVALEGQIKNSRTPTFTLWIHPSTHLLYSVEIPIYHFGLWEQRSHSSLRKPASLEIRRVSKLPPLPAPTPAPKQRVPLNFSSTDGTSLYGELILPEGKGPFPCFLALGPGGVRPRWDPGESFAQRGWAFFSYDQRGLGQSKGAFTRGALRTLAQDVLAAAEVLSQRPEIDPQRLVFLGLGEGGQIGALALPSSPLVAAALGACAYDGPLFPGLVEKRIDQTLAPFYRWDEKALARYRTLSVQRWQEWLFQGKEHVSLMRRRASLQALHEQAEIDLFSSLSHTSIPILLLHGKQDHWTPNEGAQALYAHLQETGQKNVSLVIFEELGEDLGIEENNGALPPEVEKTLFSWLKQVVQ